MDDSQFDFILYPKSTPYNRGYLLVDPIYRHEIYYEEFGKSTGIPVVYLHGGPGTGSAGYFHRLFDPRFFHIIIYDQRGAAKARPHAEIRNNAPDPLIDDNEKLRIHLGIDKWHIFGGSWGSTLALLYAERYPEKVQSMTLRGVFMMRAKEVNWFLHDMSKFFPEGRKEFEEFLPKCERDNLLESYYQRLTNTQPSVHMPAARAWTRYENGCSFLIPLPDSKRNDPDDTALCRARIEAHFFRNHMLDNRILQYVSKIRNIPTMIVQGRYDVVCPPETAYELKQELYNCRLELVAAGHSGRAPEIAKGLVAAADRIRDTARAGGPGTPIQ